MLSAVLGKSDPQSLTTDSNHNSKANSLPERYFSDLDPSDVPDPTPIGERTCRSAVLAQAADCSPANREQLGGKGMFLQRMQKAGLPVPPFECVTAQVMNALEQHSLDTRLIERCLPWIVLEPGVEISLANIREHFNGLPPSDQAKRDSWLADLAQFVASDDYYEQVKDSEAARHIRELRRQLPSSQPVIVRSSGINEDNYGDAQAGKYLSVVQGEKDVLSTCLKVMASAYRPEVCSKGIPQPMALIIQHCVDCQYGGVAMSFQSYQDDTVRVEYTPGQPKGAVAGQFGNTPHRIDILREDRKEGTDHYQYVPGKVSSHFILHKDDNGFSEREIFDADVHSNDGGQSVSDDMVSELRKVVTELEDLLLCPVDVEFAIDHQGQLLLLQVRPITRLSGGMDFTMPIPEENLASGEGISEGYCNGLLWLAKKRHADSMPEGAIVVAHHAEDWMLEPEFIKRAGGFVLAEAGFNDHIAIFLKQEQITLMRAGEQFEALAARDGQQATLACAYFNGEPGAFIVAGDITEKLASHRSLSSAVSDLPLTTAVPSRDDLSLPEGTLLQVASGFQWLTNQNARLLAFFAPGGGLDCLANPIRLSMSPQRSELLADTRDSVNRLVYGAEALLQGYKTFLMQAGNKCSLQVRLLRDELPLLINRFETLKQTIRSELEPITHLLQAGKEGQVSFRDWVAACHQLQFCLQALNPKQAEQVRSVHELIFTLHQRFVNALAPIALASDQGVVSKNKCITYVDYTTPGENVSLLRPSDKESIEEIGVIGTVVNMNDALFVNLNLGVHVSLIELLEQAEGGKGRTLRLKFTDQFEFSYFKSGKLKRMWFLTHLLKAIELDKDADTMKISFNAVAGQIVVECSRMKLRQTMHAAFEKLIIALYGMSNLDMFLEKIEIFNRVRWDFDVFAQQLNSNVTTGVDRFAFQHSLFSILYVADFLSVPDYCGLLSSHQQQFFYHAKRLISFKEKSEDSFWDIFMSDEMTDDTRKELLQHLLLLDPEKAVPLYEDVYPHLRGKYFILKPTYDYKPDFVVQPVEQHCDHNEKIEQALLKYGLEYASKRVRKDYSYIFRSQKSCCSIA